MKRKISKISSKKEVVMPVVNPHAAGIDVGSRSHFVAIGQGTDDVREFGVYTDSLHSLCQYLQGEGITSVALESTGGYWQRLFLMLQSYGLNPILVSGKFTQNVQGKKTDVQDCQWIQRMHMLGLLPNSYQPNYFTEQVRQYARHRQGLLENGASYILKMQQALRHMNIRLDVAIADVVGQSGQAIIKAILAGQQDAKYLASLANFRIRKSKEELERALTGIFRPEYIFELKQCFEMYEFLHQKIAECDAQIAALIDQHLEERECEDGVQRKQYDKKPPKRNKNDPRMPIQQFAFQLSDGVDLSEIDGVSASTLMTLISEIGLDVSQFPSAKHFASWLRLSPNNKVSGGKVISSHTKKRKNRLGQALQRVANVIGSNYKEGALHQFFMRIKFKKGHQQAIVATARKVAVIIWNMLSNKEAFNYETDQSYADKIKQQTIKNMQRKIKKMGIRAEDLISN